MIQKSYENLLCGILYLVPTPIGNFKDITYRAIEILNSSDIILTEDTRTTSILLKHYNINKKLISCHKFNEEKIKNKIVNLLGENKIISLVTDRGTPLISDPGSIVVNEVVKNGFKVISLPGATAFVPALTSSGIDTKHFLFYGFLNNKESERKRELNMLKEIYFTFIIYESPHRLTKTLQNMLNILGNRKISISREISKLYEEVFRGTLEEAISFYKDPKGEIVIVVEKNQKKKVIDYDLYLEEVEKLISSGESVSNSIKLVSIKYNISKNILYNNYQRGVK